MGRGDRGSFPPLFTNRNDQNRVATRRSRLRIWLVRMNHRSRLPVFWLRVESRMPCCSICTSTAWIVPLCSRGFRPMARVRSERVLGPCWIRMPRVKTRTGRVRTGVRSKVMIEVSVVDLFILQGGRGHCCPLVCRLTDCHTPSAARSSFLTVRFARACLPHSLPLGCVPCTRMA